MSRRSAQATRCLAHRHARSVAEGRHGSLWTCAPMTAKKDHRHRRRARSHRCRADPADRSVIRSLELAFVSSRELARASVLPISIDEFAGELRYESLDAGAVACEARRRRRAGAAERQGGPVCRGDRRGQVRYGDRRPVGRLPLRRQLVLRTAGTLSRQLSRAAPHQQSGLLCDGDAAGDRADAGSRSPRRRRASASRAIPAPARRHRTRTIRRSCATT